MADPPRKYCPTCWVQKQKAKHTKLLIACVAAGVVGAALLRLDSSSMLGQVLLNIFLGQRVSEFRSDLWIGRIAGDINNPVQTGRPHFHGSRRHSYELLAQAFGLQALDPTVLALPR